MLLPGGLVNFKWWYLWLNNECLGVGQDMAVEAKSPEDAKALAEQIIDTRCWRVESVVPFDVDEVERHGQEVAHG